MAFLGLEQESFSDWRKKKRKPQMALPQVEQPKLPTIQPQEVSSFSQWRKEKEIPTEPQPVTLERTALQRERQAKPEIELPRTGLQERGAWEKVKKTMQEQQKTLLGGVRGAPQAKLREFGHKTMQNLFGTLIEAPVGVATTLLSFPIHLAGTTILAGLGKKGWAEAEKAMELPMEVMTYQPKTEYGRKIIESVMTPLEALSWVLDKGVKTAAPDDPNTQAALRTVIGIGALVALPGIKGKVQRTLQYNKARGLPFKMRDLKNIVKKTEGIPAKLKEQLKKIPDETVLSPPIREFQSILKEQINWLEKRIPIERKKLNYKIKNAWRIPGNEFIQSMRVDTKGLQLTPKLTMQLQKEGISKFIKPLTESEQTNLSQLHHNLVQKAVIEHKSVPARVLEQYPDLIDLKARYLEEILPKPPVIKKPAAKTVEAMPHAKEAVSVEALSRLKTQSFHLYDARTKTLKPLIGVDAIDIIPKPYEAKVILNKKTGSIDYIDYGKNLTTAAKPLIEQQVFKIKRSLERRVAMEERGLIVAERPKPKIVKPKEIEKPLPMGEALEAEILKFKKKGGKVEELKPSERIKPTIVEEIEATADILGIKPEKGKVRADEYYSGYPFIKEFTESMRRLTKGELGSITKDIPVEPLTVKPQVITKKLPKIEIAPYSIPTKEPLRVVKRIKKGAMPVYKHELDALLKIEDLPARKVKYFYENPLRVIEEYPILKKTIYDPIKIAEDVIVRDFNIVKKNSWKMKRFAKKNPQRLGVYSISKQANGAEILRRMGKKVERLTPEEMRNYNAVRAELETMYIQINKARKLAGREPMPKVKNYFTFARNLETLKQLGHDPIFERDMGVLKHHMNAPPFKYALKRKKVLAPVELDFYEIYKNYMHSALRFTHKAPIIAKGRTMIGDYAFEIGGKKTNWSFKLENPRLHTYLTQWLDFQAGQTPPSIAPQWLRTMSSKLNKNIGTAVLTYNVRSALIQPTALRGAYIELGSKFLSQGIIDNFNPTMRKFAREKIPGIRSRKMDVHVEELLVSAVRKKFGKARRGVAQVGISGLQFLDIEAARITALAAYRRGIAPVKKGGLGLSPREARVYATDTITRTQASAQPSDMAPIQRTAIGKLGTIFQTFVINEWNYLSKDVIGWKNPKITTRQRVAGVARLVWATALINAMFEGVFKLRSPYPAPEWAIKHGLERGKDVGEIAGLVAREFGEQLPLVGGTIRWTTPYRTAWPASLQVAEGVTKLVDKIVSKKLKFTRRDAETVGRLLGIPGTSQAAKYLSRRKRGMTHLEALVGIRTDVPKEKKGGWTGR